VRLLAWPQLFYCQGSQTLKPTRIALTDRPTLHTTPVPPYTPLAWFRVRDQWHRAPIVSGAFLFSCQGSPGLSPGAAWWLSMYLVWHSLADLSTGLDGAEPIKGGRLARGGEPGTTSAGLPSLEPNLSPVLQIRQPIRLTDRARSSSKGNHACACVREFTILRRSCQPYWSRTETQAETGITC